MRATKRRACISQQRGACLSVPAHSVQRWTRCKTLTRTLTWRLKAHVCRYRLGCWARYVCCMTLVLRTLVARGRQVCCLTAPQHTPRTTLSLCDASCRKRCPSASTSRAPLWLKCCALEKTRWKRTPHQPAPRLATVETGGCAQRSTLRNGPTLTTCCAVNGTASPRHCPARATSCGALWKRLNRSCKKQARCTWANTARQRTATRSKARA